MLVALADTDLWTTPLDRTRLTCGSLRFADGAAVGDEEVGQLGPGLAGEEGHEVLFDLHGVFAVVFGEA